MSEGYTADGDEAISAIGGTVLVDVYGVVVGGLAMVALQAGGGRRATPCRTMHQQLVCVVALFE